MMDREKTDPIPRAIEVLVKKASVDPEFKTLLLEKRAEAASEIGLELQSSEAALIGAVTDEQLETIIAQTNVPQEHRRAFLGKAAAVMLATIGISSMVGCPTTGSRPDNPAPTGSRPDKPSDKKKTKSPPDHPAGTFGSRPD